MPSRDTPQSEKFDDPVTQYSRDVLTGRITAGPHVRASCKRHLADLKSGHERGLTFDPESADRFFRFCANVLRLSEGNFEGKPFELEPCQKFITGSIFGWKNPDGTRRFRRAYIEMSRGNGKSPLAAAIGLYGMAADNEPGAQIYSAASRREQAAILFMDAYKMVKQSPSLSERVTISGKNPPYNMCMLQRKQAGAFFRPVSRESGRSGSGVRPHFALVDEVHELQSASIMETLERSFKFRTQPLMFMTTNSGTDRNSCCWEEHTHAVNVAHGDVTDDTTFSYVCALDENDDPLSDESCWPKANPLLGVIITEDYLRDVVAQAKSIPGRLNNILRSHFCVWTDSDQAWISRTAWLACEDESLNVEDFKGKRAFAGLDLGATKDMTAKALVFDDGFTADNDPKYAAFVTGYTPEETLTERARADKAPYDIWVKEGYLIATPGKVTRFDYIAQDLAEDSQEYDLDGVAYDRYLIKYFDDALEEIGCYLNLIEHPQGYNQRKSSPLWMPQSINILEQLILEQRIRISVNPALRSACFSATFIQSLAGLRRFAKQKATGRIDMIMALTMAVGLAVQNEPEQYVEDRPIFF